MKSLVKWKNSQRRKPLILKGARQVGKTYLLRQFAKENYQNFIYCNFERDARLSEFFKNDLNPVRITNELALYQNSHFDPENTLLIFDEIQKSALALASLKYFNEDTPNYHVAAAGSLLGITLASETSFPVGQVTFLELYPLTLSEVLEATNFQNLLTVLAQPDKKHGIAEPFHRQLIEFLKTYLIVGGMPEVVANFVEHNDFDQVRELQVAILEAYINDFSKHAKPSEIINISRVYENINISLNREYKRFLYADLKKAARADDYSAAIAWLLDAQLLLRSYRVSQPQTPLKANYNAEVFKLYLNDVGLLSAKVNLDPRSILEDREIFDQFKGALTENYVAQTLTTLGYDLFFWRSEGGSQIDYLLEKHGVVRPLEVKSGFNPKSKSLTAYGEKYPKQHLLRTSLLNLDRSGKITNIPLYALESMLSEVLSG